MWVVAAACHKNVAGGKTNAGTVVVHPTFGTPMSTTRLVVVLACGANSAGTVAALKAAHASVDRKMDDRLLVVSIDAPPDPLDLSPVLEAQSLLQADRCIEAVSLDPVMSDPASNVPLGHLSTPITPRCDWASHRVEEAYGVHVLVYESLPGCHSERFRLNGRDFFIAKLNLGGDFFFAIVDDAGVYPLRVVAKDPASPANLAKLSGDELQSGVSAKLTARTHWSQQTPRGRFFLDRFIAQQTGTPFKQEMPP